MFLNPDTRNKLLQKKAYMLDQNNNPFIPHKIIDHRIYLQEYEEKDIEYKNIIISSTVKENNINIDVDSDSNDLDILIPTKMITKIKEEINDLEEVVEAEEEEEAEEGNVINLYGGGNNDIKKVVVHSFF